MVFWFIGASERQGEWEEVTIRNRCPGERPTTTTARTTTTKTTTTLTAEAAKTTTDRLVE